MSKIYKKPLRCNFHANVACRHIIIFCLIIMPAIACAKTIILVGNPRSLTSAFARYFINRGDFNVIHEPISRHNYTINNGPWGGTPSLYPKDYDADLILKDIVSTNQKSQLFIKEIASNLYTSKCLNTLAKQPDTYVIFLIRSPEQAVMSLYKLSKTEKDMGFNNPRHLMDYSKMSEIFYRLKNDNVTPILVDADDLANNSAVIISKLCKLVGISFDHEKLTWKEDPNMYKTVWMKELAHSTGFNLSAKRHAVNDHEFSDEDKKIILSLIKHNQPIYEELLRYKI